LDQLRHQRLGRGVQLPGPRHRQLALELVAADELWFYAQTGSESDGVDFASDPGAPVELELWLDGYIDPQYIYWVGDGVVHEGAGDSPVVFEPNTP
jgi:hypothetical protein